MQFGASTHGRARSASCAAARRRTSAPARTRWARSRAPSPSQPSFPFAFRDPALRVVEIAALRKLLSFEADLRDPPRNSDDPRDARRGCQCRPAAPRSPSSCCCPPWRQVLLRRRRGRRRPGRTPIGRRARARRRRSTPARWPRRWEARDERGRPHPRPRSRACMVPVQLDAMVLRAPAGGLRRLPDEARRTPRGPARQQLLPAPFADLADARAARACTCTGRCRTRSRTSDPCAVRQRDARCRPMPDRWLVDRLSLGATPDRRAGDELGDRGQRRPADGHAAGDVDRVRPACRRRAASRPRSATATSAGPPTSTTSSTGSGSSTRSPTARPGRSRTWCAAGTPIRGWTRSPIRRSPRCRTSTRGSPSSAGRCPAGEIEVDVLAVPAFAPLGLARAAVAGGARR